MWEAPEERRWRLGGGEDDIFERRKCFGDDVVLTVDRERDPKLGQIFDFN